MKFDKRIFVLTAGLLLAAVVLSRSNTLEYLLIPPGQEVNFESDAATGYIASDGFYTVISRGEATGKLSDGTDGYYADIPLQTADNETVYGLFFVDAVTPPSVVNGVFLGTRMRLLVTDYVPYAARNLLTVTARGLKKSDLIKDNTLAMRVDRMLDTQMSAVLRQNNIYPRQVSMLIYARH